MPMAANNYDKIVKKLLRAGKPVPEMHDACDDLHAVEDAETTSIVNTGVSCDGSWHHRGQSSLNGVVTVISMKNGKVLDVEAMSRVCKGCILNEELRIKDPEAYDIWKNAHICKLNYKGSAGNMKRVGAQRMWNRSVEKNKLRNAEFCGDGGSNSFNTVKNTYADIEVKKLECVGHVQKRVGCRLRNLTKKEKGLGGKGKLTDSIIDKLQNHYGIAIRSNKNKLKAMQTVAKATCFILHQVKRTIFTIPIAQLDRTVGAQVQ